MLQIRIFLFYFVPFHYCNIKKNKIFKLIKLLKKYYVQFFYVYIFDFITIFYNPFVNIKLLLIHYLRSEMVITFFPSI